MKKLKYQVLKTQHWCHQKKISDFSNLIFQLHPIITPLILDQLACSLPKTNTTFHQLFKYAKKDATFSSIIWENSRNIFGRIYLRSTVCIGNLITSRNLETMRNLRTLWNLGTLRNLVKQGMLGYPWNWSKSWARGGGKIPIEKFCGKGKVGSRSDQNWHCILCANVINAHE